jgi:hypothetical protein
MKEEQYRSAFGLRALKTSKLVFVESPKRLEKYAE